MALLGVEATSIGIKSWALLVGSLAVLFLYRWFTDPLRSVPGPFLARCTKLWLIFHDLAGDRGTTVHALHKRYGPVVRLSPDEMSFASPEALKEIYNANSKYPKGAVYDSFGFQSMFTTRDQQQYRGMKKRIVPSFSPSAVAALEPVLHKQIANLVKCFDKRLDQPLDVLPWFRMLALSVVGESFIGDSFSGLETETAPQLLNEIDLVFPVLWIWWMFPLLSSVLRSLPLPGVRDFLNAAQAFRRHCTSRYHKYLETKNPRERNDLIARLVNERTDLLEKGQSIPRHVTEDGVVDELTNLIFAGTDTTGTTLTYLFWELAHHSEWQLQLRKELKTAIGKEKFLKYDQLVDLPILEAVLQETLRVHPAALGGLPRLVPVGGAVIAGVHVPAETTVSCQALTTQRETSIFSNPDKFDPQRWIDAEKSGNVELLRGQMMVFGKGARACLGQRLATMELKCSLAAMSLRYDFAIGSETTDDDMVMTDHFVLVPKGQKCVLKLTRCSD